MAAAFEFGFLEALLAHVVGESASKRFAIRLKNNVAFVCFCASGGARMQEGLYCDADGKD